MSDGSEADAEAVAGVRGIAPKGLQPYGMTLLIVAGKAMKAVGLEGTEGAVGGKGGVDLPGGVEKTVLHKAPHRGGCHAAEVVGFIGGGVPSETVRRTSALRREVVAEDVETVMND